MLLELLLLERAVPFYYMYYIVQSVKNLVQFHSIILSILYILAESFFNYFIKKNFQNKFLKCFLKFGTS